MVHYSHGASQVHHWLFHFLLKNFNENDFLIVVFGRSMISSSTRTRAARINGREIALNSVCMLLFLAHWNPIFVLLFWLLQSKIEQQRVESVATALLFPLSSCSTTDSKWKIRHSFYWVPLKLRKSVRIPSCFLALKKIYDNRIFHAILRRNRCSPIMMYFRKDEEKMKTELCSTILLLRFCTFSCTTKHPLALSFPRTTIKSVHTEHCTPSS